MDKENQRNYELTFILSPELEEKGVDSFEQEIEKSIRDLGGDLKRKSKPEKRNLSYPIKKFQSGYYLVINFLFNPEKLEELASVLKHKKDILRHIINFVEESSFTKPEKEKGKGKKMPKAKTGKIKEIAEEITEEEIKEIKRKVKKKKKPSFAKATEGNEVELEEIDKKLEEILGI